MPACPVARPWMELVRLLASEIRFWGLRSGLGHVHRLQHLSPHLPGLLPDCGGASQAGSLDRRLRQLDCEAKILRCLSDLMGGALHNPVRLGEQGRT